MWPHDSLVVTFGAEATWKKKNGKGTVLDWNLQNLPIPVDVYEILRNVTLWELNIVIKNEDVQ